MTDSADGDKDAISSDSMPEGWELAALGDVLEERNVRVKDLDPSHQEDAVLLSLTKNFGLIPQNQRFSKRIATSDISNYKVVKNGWIVYNPYVIWEGAIHAYKGDGAGIVSPVYVVWEAVGADAAYLDFILRTPNMLKVYLTFCSGTVKRRRSIRKTAFRDIKVALPRSSEQKSIAQVLTSVEKAQEATEEVSGASWDLRILCWNISSTMALYPKMKLSLFP